MKSLITFAGRPSSLVSCTMKAKRFVRSSVMAVMAENVFVPWYADSRSYRLIDSAGRRHNDNDDDVDLRSIPWWRFSDHPTIMDTRGIEVTNQLRVSVAECVSCARKDSISIRSSSHPVVWRLRRDIWSRTSILSWLLCNRQSFLTEGREGFKTTCVLRKISAA